jgi:hypothetical protein
VEDAFLDELHSARLDEFVKTRDALARSLRKEGRRDDAEAIAAVRKPSVPVWAANQLARRNRPAVERLLEAGDAMRRAMERGDRDAFAAAQQDQAEALRKLRDAGRRLLGDTTGSTLDRLVATLQAASVDEGLRPRLGAGRLEDEPEAGGFDALAGITVAPARPGRRRPAKEATDRRRRERVAQAQEALREAKAHHRELDAAARKAERAAEKARRDADAAAAAVEGAERGLAEATGNDR